MGQLQWGDACLLLWPKELWSTGYTDAFQVISLLLLNILRSVVVRWVLVFDHEHPLEITLFGRTFRRVALGDMEAGSWKYFLNAIVNIFFRAQQFIFAWGWAQFFNVLFYTVCFDCPSPWTGNCGTRTIFLNFFFAVGLTLIATIIAPRLRAVASEEKRLAKFYGKTLLVKDEINLLHQHINDTMTDKFFAIDIGWSWIKVASTECLQDMTDTCPARPDGANFVAYGALIVLYLFLLSAFYHLFMEKDRLFRRIALITSVEQACGNRLFLEADKDSNGKLAKEELVTFLELNGIDQTFFTKAYDDVAEDLLEMDLYDGAEEGISIRDYVIHLSNVLRECRQEQEADTEVVTQDRHRGTVTVWAGAEDLNASKTFRSGNSADGGSDLNKSRTFRGSTDRGSTESDKQVIEMKHMDTVEEEIHEPAVTAEATSNNAGNGSTLDPDRIHSEDPVVSI